MIDWIKTNTLDLASRRGKASIRKSSRVMLSPYDVPNALRTYKSDDKIILEFKYISIKEEMKIVPSSISGVSFEIGKKTDRIYKILIEANLIQNQESFFSHPDSIELAIDSFINQQESKSKSTSKYSATLSAIKDYAAPLQFSIEHHN